MLNYKIPITKTISWDAAKSINLLLGGSRGMGKSWFSMYCALKLAQLEKPTQIFIIDFKKSDVYSLKSLLPDTRVAGDKNEIFLLLEYYVSLMKKRAAFVSEHTEFGATATTLGMPLYYLWYDEFGAVTPTLDTKEKKRHDELITQIALLGRQYNFGIMAIMQQASVGNSGLNSNIKEQFGFICHMGDASQQAFRQTFGDGITIPKIKLECGQGLLWMQGVTNNGAVVPFAAPDLAHIDLWKSFEHVFKRQNDYEYLTEISS